MLDEFGGRIGQAWRETDAEAAPLETVIADLLDGQYSSPVRVIAFNTAGGWSRDVSENVARELRRRCAKQARELPATYRISSSGKRHEQRFAFLAPHPICAACLKLRSDPASRRSEPRFRAGLTGRPPGGQARARFISRTVSSAPRA